MTEVTPLPCGSVFIIPSFPLIFDNEDIKTFKAVQGERTEFRTGKFSGANNAEGIGMSVWSTLSPRLVTYLHWQSGKG